MLNALSPHVPFPFRCPFLFPFPPPHSVIDLLCGACRWDLPSPRHAAPASDHNIAIQSAVSPQAQRPSACLLILALVILADSVLMSQAAYSCMADLFQGGCSKVRALLRGAGLFSRIFINSKFMP